MVWDTAQVQLTGLTTEQLTSDLVQYELYCESSTQKKKTKLKLTLDKIYPTIYLIWEKPQPVLQRQWTLMIRSSADTQAQGMCR